MLRYVQVQKIGIKEIFITHFDHLKLKYQKYHQPNIYWFLSKGLLNIIGSWVLLLLSSKEIDKKDEKDIAEINLQALSLFLYTYIPDGIGIVFIWRDGPLPSNYIM